MLDMSVHKDLWDVSFTDNSYLEVPFFFSIYSLMIEFNKYGPIQTSESFRDKASDTFKFV